MTKVIEIGNSKSRISKLINDIYSEPHHLIIEEKGVPKAVLMGIEEYESLLETLEIEQDKELMKKIKQGRKDFKNGKCKSLEEIHRSLGVV